MSTPNVKEVVREKYGQAALRVTSGAGNPCCRDDSSALEGSCDPITSNLYEAAQEGEVPESGFTSSRAPWEHLDSLQIVKESRKG